MEGHYSSVLLFGRRTMPQVRSVAADDDDTIGPNSRYMSVVNQSLAHQRKSQVLQDLDNRMTRMKIQVMEKHALDQDMRYKKMQKRLRDNLERNLAYKMVVEEHNVSNSLDYHKALGANYSYDALKPEINKMMTRLKPSYLREQKAKLQLQKSKQDQKSIIERNLVHPSLQTGLERERRERQRYAGGVNCNGPEYFRIERDRDTDFVPSTGGFLLHRWANAFAVDKTSTDEGQHHTAPQDIPDSEVDDDDNQRRLFQKVARFRRESMYSPRPNKPQKLQPLIDTKSLKSLQSEVSGTTSYKTMSVGRTRLKKKRNVTIQATELEEQDDEEVLSRITKARPERKQKKRYTLPPVRVQKRHVKARPLL